MSQGSIWTATVTITVHDGAHVPVASAVVSGTLDEWRDRFMRDGMRAGDVPWPGWEYPGGLAACALR